MQVKNECRKNQVKYTKYSDKRRNSSGYTKGKTLSDEDE